jgi:hypothetical protein
MRKSYGSTTSFTTGWVALAAFLAVNPTFGQETDLPPSVFPESMSAAPFAAPNTPVQQMGTVTDVTETSTTTVGETTSETLENGLTVTTTPTETVDQTVTTIEGPNSTTIITETVTTTTTEGTLEGTFEVPGEMPDGNTAIIVAPEDTAGLDDSTHEEMLETSTPVVEITTESEPPTTPTPTVQTTPEPKPTGQDPTGNEPPADTTPPIAIIDQPDEDSGQSGHGGHDHSTTPPVHSTQPTHVEDDKPRMSHAERRFRQLQVRRARETVEYNAGVVLERYALPIGMPRAQTDPYLVQQQIQSLVAMRGAQSKEDGTEQVPASTPNNQRPDIAELPIGITPAYLLGDINEDGTIDRADAVLLDKLASGPGTMDAYRDVGCAAAADMNMDGEINESDAPLLHTIIEGGPVTSGILYDQDRFPCGLTNSFVAFSQAPICAGPIDVRLLANGPTEGVELEPVIDGETVNAEDWPGWVINLADMPMDGSTPALLFTQAGNAYVYWLATHCALQPSKELSDKDWAETPEPSSAPEGRPTPYGEEIDGLTECPQIDKGCDALVIDFLAQSGIWQEPSAHKTRDALKKAGCNVRYVSPKFTKVPPKPDLTKYTGNNMNLWKIRYNQYVQRQFDAYDKKVSKILTGNRGQWQLINRAIAAHRTAIRGGLAMAYQMVNAHGSEGSGGTYGVWGVGWDTATGTLSRDKFHFGNYRAAKGNVCHAVMEDRSCMSGLSANAIDWLNNFSLVNCGTPPKENHRRHAAFYSDMVMTTALAANSCTMLRLNVRDYFTASYVEKTKPGKGFADLAQAFLVRGIGLGNNAPAFYYDRGYNQLPPTICKGASKRY